MSDRPLSILVGCERSGVVRDAFAALGYRAASCDLAPSQTPGEHFEEDLLTILRRERDNFDALIVHPPCTYLSSSGLHWNTRRAGRGELTDKALAFVREILAIWGDKPYCLENPVGRIGTAIRPSDQSIQPHQFGHDASKRTCLWLSGLPKLRPTEFVPGRVVVWNEKVVTRWANQTDGGQNRLGPSDDRADERSRTYEGIARAMADQWGPYLLAAAARRAEYLETALRG